MLNTYTYYQFLGMLEIEAGRKKLGRPRDLSISWVVTNQSWFISFVINKIKVSHYFSKDYFDFFLNNFTTDIYKETVKYMIRLYADYTNPLWC